MQENDYMEMMKDLPGEVVKIDPANNGAVINVLDTATGNKPKMVKYCNHCRRAMKKTSEKIPGIFICNHCKNVWMKDKGFFPLEPGMEFYAEEVNIRGTTAFVPRVRVPGQAAEELPPNEAEPRWKQAQEEGVAYERKAQQLVRGGIYYVDRIMADGHEQQYKKGRPCIVVSDVTVTDNAYIVSVVPLTSQNKKFTKTRTSIITSGRKAMALCEQVDTVDCRKVGTFIGVATPDEMAAIKKCLLYHFGLTLSASISDEESRQIYIDQLIAKINALEAQLAEQISIVNNSSANSQ